MDKDKLIRWLKDAMGEIESDSKKDMWCKGYRSACYQIIQEAEKGIFDALVEQTNSPSSE